MKYQLRMIVDVDESQVDGFFALENWMMNLPIETGELLDFGLAQSERTELDKSGNWDE